MKAFVCVHCSNTFSLITKENNSNANKESLVPPFVDMRHIHMGPV